MDDSLNEPFHLAAVDQLLVDARGYVPKHGRQA